MNGEAREKVEAEIRAQDRFLAELETNIQVRCPCGLAMTGSNYREHQKETKHPRQVSQQPRLLLSQSAKRGPSERFRT